MKLTKLFLTATLVLAALLPAQTLYPDYNLSNYQSPDLERRSLEFGFDLGQSNSDYKYQSSFNNNSNSNSLSGSLNGVYNSFKDTQTFTRNLWLYTRLQKSISDRDDDNINHPISDSYTTTSTDGYFAEINGNYTISYYLPRGFYLEAVPRSSYSIEGGEQDYKQNDSANFRDTRRFQVNNRHNFTSFLPATFGYGRIKTVSGARKAIYLVDAVAKLQQLKRTPDEAELNRLAELVDKVTNQRFLDSRDQEMAQFKAIDSFFVANGIVEKANIEYFNTISDTWRYARADRKTGWRIGGGFFHDNIEAFESVDIKRTEFKNSYLTVEEDITQNIYEQDYSVMTFGGIVNAAYEQPLGLNWQLGGNAAFKAGTRSYDIVRTDSEKKYVNNNLPTVNTTESTEYKKDYTLKETSGDLYIGFYPSTRSYLQISVDGKYTDLQDLCFDYSLSGRISAYLYLSPQTRINAGYSLSMNRSANNLNPNSFITSNNSTSESTYSSFSLSYNYYFL